jgi:hypothetical protein
MRKAKPAGGPVQSRTLLFQLVESEISVADALLEMDDVDCCDQHLAAAMRHADELRGPENLLMTQRISSIRQKRAAYPCPVGR